MARSRYAGGWQLLFGSNPKHMRFLPVPFGILTQPSIRQVEVVIGRPWSFIERGVCEGESFNRRLNTDDITSYLGRCTAQVLPLRGVSQGKRKADEMCISGTWGTVEDGWDLSRSPFVSLKDEVSMNSSTDCSYWLQRELWCVACGKLWEFHPDANTC